MVVLHKDANDNSIINTAPDFIMAYNISIQTCCVFCVQTHNARHVNADPTIRVTVMAKLRAKETMLNTRGTCHQIIHNDTN